MSRDDGDVKNSALPKARASRPWARRFNEPISLQYGCVAATQSQGRCSRATVLVGFFRSLKKCMDLPARWQASQRTPCPVLHPSCKRLRSLAPYGCNAASISPSGDKVMIRANARNKMRLTSAPTPNAPRRAARPFPYCTIE